MSQQDDTRFDGIFMNVIQQKQGINGFFDSVFSFLRRQTDFFTDKAQAEKVMIKSCTQQYEVWEKSQKSKAEQEEEKKKREEQRKQKEQERKQKEEEQKKKKEEEEKQKQSQKQQEQEKKEENKTQDGEKKEGEEEEDNTPAPIGNGGKTDKYIWTQTLDELHVYIPISSDLKAKQLDIQINPKDVKVQNKANGDLLLNGSWFEAINSEDSFWTIEDGEVQDYNGKHVHLSVSKWKNNMHWWDCVVQGGEKINTQKIQPENSNLGDLDGETRSTVEKMMFDMRQKQMGKPSSDELKKQEMLQAFMKEHPEMDFSKAKFG